MVEGVFMLSHGGFKIVNKKKLKALKRSNYGFKRGHGAKNLCRSR